jgi:hypothetical protein
MNERCIVDFSLSFQDIEPKKRLGKLIRQKNNRTKKAIGQIN